MTQQNVPTKCPRCGSPKPELHPAMQFEGEVEICTHPWHRDPAAPKPVIHEAVTLGEMTPVATAGDAAPPEGETDHFREVTDMMGKEGKDGKVASPAMSAAPRTGADPCEECGCEWNKAHAPTCKYVAPPAGMSAADLEAEWLAQSEHLDYRNWLQVQVIYLRGEVERVTQESIQYDELREQQIWQLEDALARLREQVLQTTKAIIESERAELESTTPQEEK